MFLLLDELHLGSASWHDSFKHFLEAFVHLDEAELKGLLLLYIEVLKKLQKSSLDLREIFQFSLLFLEFGRVLIIPLDTVSVGPRKLLQFFRLPCDFRNQSRDVLLHQGILIKIFDINVHFSK